MSSPFMSYDIRGIYPSCVDEKLFYKIGLILNKLKYKKIAVGRDARNSSESLHAAFCTGLIIAGIDIIDLGVVTSPMLSFYCVTNKIHGAMITASHNPKEYNGLKFIDECGIQLGYKDFTYKIEKILKTKNPQKFLSKNKGRVTSFDLTPIYSDYIYEKFKNSFDKKLKIVFDCSNGVAHIPLSNIIKRLNIESIFINKKPDGNFPNHEPNQTIKNNFKQLRESVLKNSADLGVMFDGDADRMAFVDETGDIIEIDTIFILFAKNLIDKNIVKKPKVLFDLRFSRYVYEFLDLYGAKPFIMKVGNPYYKKIMYKDKNVILSGELSGHIMFSENYGIDDGIFAALRFIEIISHRDKKVSEIVLSYKKYYNSGEVSMDVRNPEKAVREINHLYRKERKKYLDGISVIKKRVWFNARKSNTESLLRVIVEGINKEDVNLELDNIKRIIKENDKN